MWKEIPPFSRTCVDAAACPYTWWAGIVGELILRKKCWNFIFWSGSWPGISSAWFSGSARFGASSSSLRVFNFLDWKWLMVNLKMHLWGQIYQEKWFSDQKVEYPGRTWTCCEPAWAWKPGWACNWSWTRPKNKIQNFFLTIKPATMPVHHIKGQPFYSNLVSPCS